jgi:hypothetical protein
MQMAVDQVSIKAGFFGTLSPGRRTRFNFADEFDPSHAPFLYA